MRCAPGGHGEVPRCRVDQITSAAACACGWAGLVPDDGAVIAAAYRNSLTLRCLDGVDGVVFHCPACDATHQVVLSGPTHWAVSGLPDRPTFWPSIKVTKPSLLGDDVCHSFVTLGRIAYQGDCTHRMAGQSIDIPPWPHPRGSYAGILEPTKKDAPAA